MVTAGHRELARTLRRAEERLAEVVADAALARHPEWAARHGDQALAMGIEHARLHVQFLGSAIESDSPAAFADYVQWTARVLTSRGIDPRFLDDTLSRVRQAAAPLLSTGEAEVLDRFMAAALASSPAEASPAAAVTALTSTRQVFSATILKGNRRAALNIANEALRDGVAIPDLYADIFQESLREVGRLWENNLITVAQEHMATAVTQYVMAQIFDRIPVPDAVRGTAVVTGVPGELHHIGSLMIADVLEAHGWRVQFLGSNLPVPAIVAAIAEASPDLLGVSVTMLFNLHQASRLIASVRELGKPIRIVVGGAAFRVATDWRQTGADAYAPDLKSAISLLCTP